MLTAGIILCLISVANLGVEVWRLRRTPDEKARYEFEAFRLGAWFVTFAIGVWLILNSRLFDQFED